MDSQQNRMKVNFKTIKHGTDEWHTAVKLREKILREPLGQSFTAEELAIEKDHIQVVGRIGEEIVSTAVLVPEVDSLKMQRVVVKENLQNSEIGSNMMIFCEELAKPLGMKFIYCHARDTAVNFYLKNDYNSQGDYFDEDEIPHLKMIKFIGS